MSYCNVNIEDFRKVLVSKGFVEVQGSEIFFERPHERDSRLSIRIFTSIPRGCSDSRGRGKDAIRVSLVMTRKDKNTGDDRTFGLGKTKRVNRTGTSEDVVARVVERAREMWKLGKTIKIYK